MKDARPKYASLLEFVKIEDFTENADFQDAVQGVDGIVHAASVRSASHKGPFELTTVASNVRHEKQ
jgi:hypothetical protein